MIREGWNRLVATAENFRLLFLVMQQTDSTPETQTKRQVTLHDCLPSLLGDGDKWIEIVYSEEKYILYWVS